MSDAPTRRKPDLKKTLRLHAIWLRGGAGRVRADLSGADYDDQTLWPEFQIVADSGPFWMWKKLQGGIIAHVEVSAEAARVSSTGRKCRAEYVTVLALYGPDATALGADAVGLSQHDGKTEYRVGAIVRPDTWDPDFRVEYSHGIHGFLRRKEAEQNAY